MVCAVLSKEETGTSNLQSKTLLNQCRQFLSTNKNPQERLAITQK